MVLFEGDSLKSMSDISFIVIVFYTYFVMKGNNPEKKCSIDNIQNNLQSLVKEKRLITMLMKETLELVLVILVTKILKSHVNQANMIKIESN